MADINVKPGESIDIDVNGVALLTKRLRNLKYDYGNMQDEQKYGNLSGKPVERTQARQDRMDKLANLIQSIEAKIKAATQKADSKPNKLNAMFEQIAVECSDIIAVMKQTHTVLRRGAGNNALVFKGHPRADRKPTTSDPEMQKQLDTELSDAGFKALRGNSLFVTTDYDFAKAYGTMYLIFPVNGFAYTWMPHTKELILGGDNVATIPDIWQFSEHHLDEAMSAGHEILLKGDFYALRANALESKVEEFFGIKLK
jgi:hypothetical protein